MGLIRLLVAVVIAAGCAIDGFALVFVSSRNALHADDYIDWGQFNSTHVDPPYSGFTNLGRPFNLNNNDNLFRCGQGQNCFGDFANGDQLLVTYNGVVDIVLSQPVEGIGTQLDVIYQGDAYVAHIEAFNSQNASLGSFDADGTSRGLGDGSALFVGVADSQPDIARLHLTATYANGPHFAINRTSIATVPEPGALAAFGLPALYLLMRRRNLQPADS